MKASKEHKPQQSRVIHSYLGQRKTKITQFNLFDDNTGAAIKTPETVGEWGPMKRHHIVSRSKIRDFIDNMVTLGKTSMLNDWLTIAVSTHFGPSMVGKKHDSEKNARLRLGIGITKKNVIKNGFNQRNGVLFQELSSAFQWTAGNIVPGPANRSDDPRNMNDLDEPLLKITGNEIGYKAVNNMVNLPIDEIPNKLAIIRTGLDYAKKIYKIKTQRVPQKEMWVRETRNSNRWRVK